MTDPSNPGPVRGRRVRPVVAAVVLAESIVVVGSGFVLGIDTLAGSPVSRVGEASLALLVVLLGAALGWVGVALARGRRSSRAPALVWQVLQFAVGAPAFGSRPLVGAALVGTAALVVVGLFVPGVLEDPADGASPLPPG